MSGKKKRMRETVIEDVGGSGQECENSTRNCDDLIGLLQLIKKKQEEEENAKGTALEKHQKMDTVKQSGEVVVTDTVNATGVQCAKTLQRKKNKKRYKSKKKAGELASSPIVIQSDSQTEVQNNIVSTDSSDSAVQSRLITESTEPVSQRKKKQIHKLNVDHVKASQELNTCQPNNTSNGQFEEESDVIIMSDHSAVDLLQAPPEIIDLTSEDSTLEDPSSFEPYSKHEICMAQACMDLEMTQGRLRWFLSKLKIRNTAARFVPRMSIMEKEYAQLEDNFPMPFSD